MFKRGVDQNFRRQSAQAPPRAVAQNGVAYFAAGGQAKADRGSWRAGRAYLQDKSGRNPFLPARRNGQKLGPLFKDTDFRRKGIQNTPVRLGCKLLTALSTTTSDDLTAISGRHAGAIAMTARANQLAGLIGTFHCSYSTKLRKTVVYRVYAPKSQTPCRAFFCFPA